MKSGILGDETAARHAEWKNRRDIDETENTGRSSQSDGARRRAPSIRLERSARAVLLRVLVLQLLEVLAGHVHPLLLGGHRGRDADVALPLGDRLARVQLLEGHREVVVRGSVLGLDLDDLLVLS